MIGVPIPSLSYGAERDSKSGMTNEMCKDLGSPHLNPARGEERWNTFWKPFVNGMVIEGGLGHSGSDAGGFPDVFVEVHAFAHADHLPVLNSDLGGHVLLEELDAGQI